LNHVREVLQGAAALIQIVVEVVLELEKQNFSLRCGERVASPNTQVC